MLEDIEHSSIRIGQLEFEVLQIIDNMVSHARAPGGELPLAPEPFDASETVSACVAQLMPFARQTGHSMRVALLACTS